MPCTSMSSRRTPKASISFGMSLRLVNRCMGTPLGIGCDRVPRALLAGALLDLGELHVARRVHRDLGAAGVALDLAQHAHVAAFELLRRRPELAAQLLRDAGREGVARERAAHVQEGRLAFRVLGVAGLLDLAADHAVLADVAGGLVGADGVL